jgi:hypothetical protein
MGCTWVYTTSTVLCKVGRNLGRMELEVFETTYSKHQQKIWKKNKTKRLVRRIAKHTAKKQSVK